MKPSRTWLASLGLLLATASPVVAQADSVPHIVGRWDLRVQGADGLYPSWLEVTTSGYRALVGRFVGRVGSARPIGRVDYKNGALSFSIPPQWDRDTAELRLEGKLDGERITGTITTPDGARQSFTGTRAP